MIKFKYMKAITTFLFALSFILPLNVQAEYEMHIPNCTQKGVENCGGFLFDNETGDVLFCGGGGDRRSQRGERGSDLQYNLEIKFEDAAFGISRELEIPRMETCNTCGGLGARSQSDIETCNNCGGTGQQRIQQGFFSVATTCAACSGRGQTIRNVCNTCHGRTRVKKTRNIRVNIPAGVDTGSRIKLSGEGEHEIGRAHV